jgi:hypothetical protein
MLRLAGQHELTSMILSGGTVEAGCRLRASGMMAALKWKLRKRNNLLRLI